MDDYYVLGAEVGKNAEEGTKRKRQKRNIGFGHAVNFNLSLVNALKI